jgi:hypothetical protein
VGAQTTEEITDKNPHSDLAEWQHCEIQCDQRSDEDLLK